MICSLAFILSNVNTVLSLNKVSSSQWQNFTKTSYDWLGNILMRQVDYEIPDYAEMSIEELRR